VEPQFEDGVGRPVIDHDEVERGTRERELYRERIAGVMDGLDLLLTPTLATVAPPSGLGDLQLRDSLLRFTLPWNTVGAPALALPCGFSPAGLPLSLQIAGRPFDEALVLRAGHAYQQATDWHTRHPSL